jgi:cyclopropane fatty-acyl-phospholipid synthase-like methyltransferase
MLPADFLHYGYFDDPERLGDDISLSDLACAQERYAELLLEHSGDSALPALDVGCGMGGLSRMLRDRGYTPVALTPDRSQAVYVSQRLPGVQVIRSKLEDLPAAEHAGRYGTIFTAESLQYLRLDRALPILAKILAPGGRWVACDYFRTQRGREKSGHLLEEFTAKLDQHGWRIAAQRDITPHVLPTLRFAHMWAERFGIPLMQFAFQRIRRKHPGLRHLLKDVLETLENAAHANVSLIHPHEFAANKRYQHLTLERTA